MTEAVASIALISERLGGLARSPGDCHGTFAGAAGRLGVHCRCYLLLAWQRRLPAVTWIGSMVAMVGLVHAAVWNYPAWSGSRG